MADAARPVVNVQWLLDQSNASDLCIVDGSWHMPATGRNGYAEYLHQHIPGSVFFDIDKHSTSSELPHMLPSADQFAQAAGELGINEKDTIIVYDSIGLLSAARVWWMFRYFGAANVMLLDGGLPAYLESGGELESGPASILPRKFKVNRAYGRSADVDEVLAASQNSSAIVLDARSRGRFAGTEPEPRDGLRAGHIPGSASLPFTDLLDSGSLKSNEDLSRVFTDYGVTENSPIITTCGSGVTAAIITLALYCIGIKDTALYDGSWSEWGLRDHLPVQTGEQVDRTTH